MCIYITISVYVCNCRISVLSNQGLIELRYLDCTLHCRCEVVYMYFVSNVETFWLSDCKLCGLGA